MISFCKSSIHSILGIPDRRNPPPRRSPIVPPPDGAGLRLLAADSPKPDHAGESAGGEKASSSSLAADPGAWGLHEPALAGGGLGICTESLGSESCDSGIEIGDGEESAAEKEKRNGRRGVARRRAEVRFPPPLKWMMGRGGRRSRFLKGERRDGRFVLREIEIDRPPEILRAIRSEGRLRLELVRRGFGSGGGEGESPEAAEIAGEESEGRWELPPVRSEGQRCVEAVSGDGVAPLWWSHGFATTA